MSNKVTKMFPVITSQSDVSKEIRATWPRQVPWEIVEPGREQAKYNHDQTLEELASRGGMGPDEIYRAVNGMKNRQPVNEIMAAEWLKALVQIKRPPTSALPEAVTFALQDLGGSLSEWALYDTKKMVMHTIGSVAASMRIWGYRKPDDLEVVIELFKQVAAKTINTDDIRD